MSLPKHAFNNKSSLIGSGDSPKEDEKRTDFRRVIHIPRTVIYDIFVKILVKLDKEILRIPSFGQLWFPFLPVPLMVMATLGGHAYYFSSIAEPIFLLFFPIFSIFWKSLHPPKRKHRNSAKVMPGSWKRNFGLKKIVDIICKYIE